MCVNKDSETVTLCIRKRCTVAVCNNSHSKIRDNGISYFNFPKDTELRKKWVHLCRRGGKWNPDSCSVCSEHFLPEDSERDLKSKCINLPITKKLKPTAVPFLKLCKPNTVSENETSTKFTRNYRYVNREKKQIESLLAPEIIPDSTLLEVELPATNTENQPCQNQNMLELVEENNVLKSYPFEENRIIRNKTLKV